MCTSIKIQTILIHSCSYGHNMQKQVQKFSQRKKGNVFVRVFSSMSRVEHFFFLCLWPPLARSSELDMSALSVHCNMLIIPKESGATLCVLDFVLPPASNKRIHHRKPQGLVGCCCDYVVSIKRANLVYKHRASPSQPHLTSSSSLTVTYNHAGTIIVKCISTIC